MSGAFHDLRVAMAVLGFIVVPIVVLWRSFREGKQFRVYEHPTLGFEAVKVGFSLPAFFFGLFWMLAKKLWKLAGLWFGIYLICSIAETVADGLKPGDAQTTMVVILLMTYAVLWILPGAKGNEWRERNLVNRGYECRDTVTAKTPAAAVAQSVRRPAAPITSG